MYRCTFKADAEDSQPVNWPIKHPYWETGYDDYFSYVLAYADDMDYILNNWPEAQDIRMEPIEDYCFTARFPKPEWFDSQ